MVDYRFLFAPPGQWSLPLQKTLGQYTLPNQFLLATDFSVGQLFLVAFIPNRDFMLATNFLGQLFLNAFIPVGLFLETTGISVGQRVLSVGILLGNFPVAATIPRGHISSPLQASPWDTSQ